MSTIRPIHNQNELESALQESHRKPVLIFKHSTTCPISAKAKRAMDSYANQCREGGPPIYQVIVQEARPVSNEIASRLDVEHHSPQVLLVKDGESTWNCSHYDITEENLQKAVQEA